MTQDEIIELARQAGWKDLRDYDSEMRNDIFMGSTSSFEAFAKLVAEKEREACAAICDELHKARVGKDNYFAFAANAIRELRAKQ
jgi:hypothetical protein